MKLSRELLIQVGKEIIRVYEGAGMDLGHVEFNSTLLNYQDELYQIIAVGGTDELRDWFWNLVPFSRDGVKLCSYFAAEKIHNHCVPIPGAKLIIGGHSKAGPTALYYKQRYGAYYAIAFCPARGFRKQFYMENTTLVIDPDDLVPKLGRLFKHPEPEQMISLEDSFGFSIKDHSMESVVKNLS